MTIRLCEQVNQTASPLNWHSGRIGASVAIGRKYSVFPGGAGLIGKLKGCLAVLRWHMAANVGLTETDAGSREHFAKLGQRLLNGLANFRVWRGENGRGLIAAYRYGDLHRPQLWRIYADLGNLLVILGEPDYFATKVLAPVWRME